VKARAAAALTALVLLAGGSASAAARPTVEFAIPTASSGPADITYGPAGNVWFVDQLSGRLGRVTHQGAITGYAIPTAHSLPAGIAYGPDGALWFTEQAANRIGRYQPATRTWREWKIPTAGSGPRGIAVGPDDALWFCEHNANRIGRITLSGRITEYPLPVAASGPSRIVTAADGELWITQAAADMVAQLTTGGQVTEHPLPAGSRPARIAAGPDADVWVTMPGTDQVAHISTQGSPTVTRLYSLPTPAAGPLGIATGPDGNLWVAEQTADKLARITPQGAITEFPIPTAAAQPSGVTLAEDGNVWFSEYRADRVGYIKTNAGAHVINAVVRDAVPAGSRLLHGVVGDTVRWIFAGPSPHSVTDATGLGLYDSGALGPTAIYAHTFGVAGDYAYASTVPGDASTGLVKVAMHAPATGGRGVAFNVTWATAPLPAATTVQVQVQTPAVAGFADWLPAATGGSAAYTPSLGAGAYLFRARLVGPGGAGGWSPVSRVGVS
jgi:virginiamycin B lyase